MLAAGVSVYIVEIFLKYYKVKNNLFTAYVLETE